VNNEEAGQPAGPRPLKGARVGNNGAKKPKIGLLLFVLVCMFALLGVFADLAAKSAH
jgi:hypothetical protein